MEGHACTLAVGTYPSLMRLADEDLNIAKSGEVAYNEWEDTMMILWMTCFLKAASYQVGKERDGHVFLQPCRCTMFERQLNPGLLYLY